VFSLLLADITKLAFTLVNTVEVNMCKGRQSTF